MANRRPATPRQWKGMRAVATWLVERKVDPNHISLWALLVGILAGVAFGSTDGGANDRLCWFLGALCLLLRGTGNILDGLVAVEGGRKSAIGGIYNDAPDRVSDVAMLIGLGYGYGGVPELGYLAAIGAVTTAYVRELGVALDQPADFGGTMGKSGRVYLMLVLCAVGVIAPALHQPRWQSPMWIEGAGVPAVVLLIMVCGAIETCASRLTRMSRGLRASEARH